MEPESSLPRSQVPATCFCSETPHLLKVRVNIILPSTPGSSKWSLSLRFYPPKRCMHLSCPYPPIYAWIFQVVSFPQVLPTQTLYAPLLSLSPHLRLDLPVVSFPQVLPTQTLYASLLSSMHATFATRLILLHFIIRIILDDECRSLNCWLSWYLRWIRPFAYGKKCGMLTQMACAVYWRVKVRSGW